MTRCGGLAEQAQACFFLQERKMITCVHKKVVMESYSLRGKRMLKYVRHSRNFGRATQRLITFRPGNPCRSNDLPLILKIGSSISNESQKKLTEQQQPGGLSWS
jgi:hypothetical protein